MYKYNLYMAFGGEVSDDTDLYGLALTATYFEIEPENGQLFKGGMIDELPVFRKDWDEITIKNNPLEYKTDPTSKNKLYNLIFDNPTTSIYFLKFVCGTETRYGYFGEVDCSINEDRTLIKVTPTIVDPYTDFIENYEKETDVFGKTNLIRNGDFSVWNGTIPAYWVNGILGGAVQDTLLDKPCGKLGHGLLFGTMVGQSVSGVSIGKQALIEFDYAFTGDNEIRKNLTYNVTLTGTTKTYQLSETGEWVESGTINKITYKSNAYPLPEESITEFDHYNLLTDPLPQEGFVAIYFYNDDAINDFIYLTGVQINSSDMAFIDLSLVFPTNYLVIKPQEEVVTMNTGWRYYPDFIAAGIKSNDIDESTIDAYFESNGSPNMTLLADTKWGVYDDSGLKYPDWKTIFDTDPTSLFYKGELCELTIEIGNEYNIFPKKRNIHGYAKYAREETYIVDTYDEFNQLIPPDGGGWVSTNILQGVSRLWVRKPFNGAYSEPNTETWVLGTKEYDGADFWRKQTTVKTYPTSDNSTSIGTGIDFRDICRKIYRSTHNSRLGKEVYSAFFWNDSPYMDFLDLETGLNYYTMKQNFLNKIACVHTSTIKEISNPDLSDSELKISFKELFDDLLVKFPSLVWFIDSNLNLHFEHTRFLHRTQNYVDMTSGVLPYVGEYKSYKYDTSKLFGNIIREDINSYYKDFKKSEETFRKITTNKRRKDSKETKRTSYISADIMGAIENSGDLGNGMVLVAYKVNDNGDNEMIYGTGQITGNDIPNGVLSTSYLLKQFGNYVGTWHEGIIDKESILYRFSQYCRIGSDITLKGIVDENYLYTEIGIALIQSKKYDYDKEVTICTPVYRHVDWYIVATENDVIQMEYEYNLS